MSGQYGQSPRLVGRYLLYGEIAAGGMATVHFGRLSGPVGFSRTVAIKRLHPQFAKDPEFVSMFLDEARLCGRIRHPNVVPTVDVVTLEGEIFIVMEYVAGEAFSKLLRTAWTRGIPVPPRVAATIVASVLHGLHAAHLTKDEQGRELGIVHRDVSPQNILVGTDGVPRVLDFGVAKAAGRLQTTRDGQVKGKIAYMPPEQLSGGGVSRQTDIYAAAVVLWEALAGRRLFDGETEAIVLVRAIEGRIDRPSLYNPMLDASADAVVMRGLARDPSHRFATAREMAVALEQTIGVASPYEVGEWVEFVAGDELARRAARIAEIESASLSGRLRSLPPMGPSEPSHHSQVSSISVSRPALSTPTLRPKGGGAKVFAAVALLLALIGVGFGLAAYPDLLTVNAAAERNRFEPTAREIAIVRPAMRSAKAPLAPEDVAPIVTHRAPPPPRAEPAKPKANPCDPPYNLDPETGRKKYKIECLK
jgi:eukaryotic-like serine/threonine-protein kinase